MKSYQRYHLERWHGRVTLMANSSPEHSGCANTYHSSHRNPKCLPPAGFFLYVVISAFTCILRFDYPDEAVPTTRKSLDEDRPLGIVPQRHPDLRYSCVERAIEVDKCVLRPDLRLELVPRHQ